MNKTLPIISLLLLLLLSLCPANAQDIPRQAEEILQGMGLEEKVAQLFLARCPGSGALAQVEEYGPGGYILFADHFKDQDPASVRELIASWQEASPIPMLIGVDEEGGTVTRVSRYQAFRAEKFRSPRALFEEGGIPRIVEDAQEKSELLLSLGVNFNLAPVADISTSSGDFMYSRSLGQDPETTSLYVGSVVEAMNQCGIASALKHFPGYGSNRDTHNGIARDKRPYDSFVTGDFLPFQAGIEAGAGCIMVSHNIVNCMDAKRPASLSPKVHRILREELGFSGVIMTDDLAMGAISKFAGKKSAAVTAVRAGNDLLCVKGFAEPYNAVLKAVKKGAIEESRIDESVRRILIWKLGLGIIPSSPGKQPGPPEI